jgi:hypothetical protein
LLLQRKAIALVAWNSASIGRPRSGNHPLEGHHERASSERKPEQNRPAVVRGACRAALTAAPALFCWNAIVPPWLEILLDVLGFAGFVGLAIWHKAPRKDDETLQG